MAINDEEPFNWFLGGDLLRPDATAGANPYDEDPYDPDPYD